MSLQIWSWCNQFAEKNHNPWPIFLLLAPQEVVFVFLTADLSQPFGTDMVVISEENKPSGTKKVGNLCRPQKIVGYLFQADLTPIETNVLLDEIAHF